MNRSNAWKLAVGFGLIACLLLLINGLSASLSARHIQLSRRMTQTYALHTQLQQVLISWTEAEAQAQTYLLLGAADDKDIGTKDCLQIGQALDRLPSSIEASPRQNSYLQQVRPLLIRRMIALKALFQSRLPSPRRLTGGSELLRWNRREARKVRRALLAMDQAENRYLQQQIAAFELYSRRIALAFLALRLAALASLGGIYGSVWKKEGLAKNQNEAQMQTIRRVCLELEAQKTELEKANHRLEALATSDGLTGLKNHRAFQEQFEQEFQRSTRYQTPLSLLLLDVDFFKQYNDAFGHPAGDEVLKTIGCLLRAHGRDTDVVARYGGEEFAVVLPNAGREEAKQAAERLREAIERTVWNLRPVTISVGIATRMEETLNGAALIHAADTALYEAKRRGRNGAMHFADCHPGVGSAISRG